MAACANEELGIFGPRAFVAIVPELSDIVGIILNPPKTIIVGRIGRLALLELDDIDGVVRVFFYLGVIDELEDRGCAEILAVLHTNAYRKLDRSATMPR